MKGLFKKLAAGVTAACMCAAMAVNVQTSADAFNCGDINRDGQVSMLDQTTLNRYLAGMIELADYSLADVTGNYVINVIDSKVLLNYLMGRISNLPYRVETEHVTVDDLKEAEQNAGN